jgi:hypothetical protein
VYAKVGTYQIQVNKISKAYWGNKYRAHAYQEENGVEF